MAGKTPRPQATQERTLTPMLTQCPGCGHRMWWDYTNNRKVATLEGVVRLWLQIRRCPNPDCSRYHRPYRPEEEGRIVLPDMSTGWVCWPCSAPYAIRGMGVFRRSTGRW